MGDKRVSGKSVTNIGQSRRMRQVYLLVCVPITTTVASSNPCGDVLDTMLCDKVFQ